VFFLSFWKTLCGGDAFDVRQGLRDLGQAIALSERASHEPA